MVKGGNLNLIELFMAGGWVMYPILALSVITMAVTIERIIVLVMEKIKMKPEKFLDMFFEIYEKNGSNKVKTVEEMVEYCKKKGSVGAEIMLAGFSKFLDGTKKGMTPTELKQWVSSAMEAQANVELPWLDKHLVSLAVISNVSTLCGLFGTVIGMIESFTAMANAPGGVKADEMAGGIAVALVATAGGLCVAVPSLLLYNIIKGSITSYVSQIEEMSIKIIDTLVE